MHLYKRIKLSITTSVQSKLTQDWAFSNVEYQCLFLFPGPIWPKWEVHVWVSSMRQIKPFKQLIRINIIKSYYKQYNSVQIVYFT